MRKVDFILRQAGSRLQTGQSMNVVRASGSVDRGSHRVLCGLQVLVR